MGQAYWIFEYIKTLIVYGLVFYLWTKVVFHAHLHKKDTAYRFAFCTLVPVAVFTTVITILGILHILNTPLVAVLFYGSFVVQLLRNFKPFRGISGYLKSVNNRTMTTKRLFVRLGGYVVGKIKSFLHNLWSKSQGRRLGYAVLILCVIFGMIYFSYNAFQLHSYGASDQYVHHAWIWQMANGTIFPKGIYPLGMHCVIFIMSSLFGLSIYSVNLFLAGIYIHAILLSACLMAREMFNWQFTPVFVIGAFLFLDQLSIDGVGGFARLSWTLPQEFAFPAMFLCAWGFLRFLKRQKTEHSREIKWYKKVTPASIIRDEDLFIFMMGTAVTLMVHFYTTLMALFICIVIFLVYLVRIIVMKKILRIIAAVVFAVILAIVPMALAYAAGYQIQGSLEWAIAVSKGGEDAWANSEYDPNKDYLAEEDAEYYMKINEEAGSLAESASKEIKPNIIQKAYYKIIAELYPGNRGKLMIGLTLLLFAVSLAATIINGIRRKKENKTMGYLCISGILLVLLLEYSPESLGLPILIAGSRLCAVIQLFAVMVYMSFPDMLFSAIKKRIKYGVLTVASALICIGIYVFAQMSGHFHGFLYNELSRYPAAADMTERIIKQMPENMYTIISTTDEYYQVIGKGFHEEMIDLTENWTDETYTIPTPYVYIFIEKKPLDYSQILFASGPAWLGAEKYEDMFAELDESRYPDILHGEISDDRIHDEMREVLRRSDTASMLYNREILESRGNAWLNRFMEIYPYEGSIVYEDNDFICYCFRQNADSLFSLGIMEEE